MNGEKAPSDLLRLGGFAAENPSLCLVWVGVDAADGLIPLFSFNVFVELCRANVVVYFRLVVHVVRVHGFGVGACFGILLGKKHGIVGSA